MLRKPEESPPPSTNRYKLPLESEIRSLAGIKELLAMAKESRGTQIELSWTTKVPDQIFVLDVQWEAGKPDPFWCLYEENIEQSKRLWAQPFSANNVEMFYDVLVMSCGAVDHSKDLKEILKPKPNADKEETAKPAGQGTSATSSSEPGTQSGQTKNVTTDAASAGTNSSVDPNVAAVPGYPMPGGGGMPGNPLAGFPMQAYNMPPYIQPVPIPVPYPGNQPAVNFPGMPPVSAWPYPAYAQPGMVPGQVEPFILDNALLNKQNDVGLIDLLIKAELLTEPVLAAVLKMRDLVLAKQLSMDKAVELLKRDHNKGEAIGDNFELTAPAAAEGPSKSASVGEKPKKPEDNELIGSLSLLEKAGLLSADDIKTAKGVSRKHGGDLVAILGAANKLDINTAEAAKICNGLQQSGLMKLEQCVILLNYCSRSRVSFDEAISELNWENPRKAKK